MKLHYGLAVVSGKVKRAGLKVEMERKIKCKGAKGIRAGVLLEVVCVFTSLQMPRTFILFQGDLVSAPFSRL